MKLLLDESIPRTLAGHFPDHIEVSTVPELGWAGTKNGKLLALAAKAGFDALIRADKGIEYQQNISQLPLTVIVLAAYRTRVDELAPLVPRVVELLDQDTAIGVYRVAV